MLDAAELVEHPPSETTASLTRHLPKQRLPIRKMAIHRRGRDPEAAGDLAEDDGIRAARSGELDPGLYEGSPEIAMVVGRSRHASILRAYVDSVHFMSQDGSCERR
jgi:hypothetical protein